jgi:hypothetical protein
MNAQITEVSVEDEIRQIEMERPHVVLLGAGASRAAFPNGEAGGKRLPLMADFVEIVPVRDILGRSGIRFEGRNFEELYAEISTESKWDRVRGDLESAVFDYFSALRLPPEPTLYDHLILSLRAKDVIATFNWDPFLIQAIRRNPAAANNHPKILFLHGNVAAGYCRKDNVHGVRNGRCSCGQPFEPSRLLYPVATKRYDDDPAIAAAWRESKISFEAAFMVTIFGYGAPQSDASAVTLLDEAWGGWQKRSMEQFEIIDVRPEEDLVKTWDRFIHTHHYEVHSSAYDSWLFKHPRRSGEAYLNQYINALFINDNPVPRDSSFDELRAWIGPLIERERGSV